MEFWRFFRSRNSHKLKIDCNYKKYFLSLPLFRLQTWHLFAEFKHLWHLVNSYLDTKERWWITSSQSQTPLVRHHVFKSICCWWKIIWTRFHWAEGLWWNIISIWGLHQSNLLQDCHLKAGSLFADPRFPPEESSLYYSRGGRGLVWRRPGELCERPHLYVDGATRHDINQGLLGNCWLLAAFSSLSYQRNKLEAVLPPGQSFTNNYAGIFLFRLGSKHQTPPLSTFCDFTRQRA